MSRDSAVLLDILKAAHLAKAFVEGTNKARFCQDLKTQSAVVHQLTIVGEAVKRLSEPFRASHPGIPWKQMAGMRDILVHDYDDIDLEELWRTVSIAVPELIGKVEPLTRER